MNPKLTAKNLLNYIRTTKDKPKFRSRKDTLCPIAWYLKSLGYAYPHVSNDEIFYYNKKGASVEYSNLDPHYPKWIDRFIMAYDSAGPKHRLRTASKVLEQVITKQVNRKMTTKSFGK